MVDYVKLHGSYTFAHKVNKIDSKHIKKLAQHYGVVKLTMSRKVIRVAYVKD